MVKMFDTVVVQIIILMVSGGCMNYPKVVEAKDVRFFEIKEVNVAGTRALKLKGLVFHSALAVEGIDITQEGNDMRVTVKLTPAKKGLSGSFEVEIPLKSQDSRVLFGTSDEQIWPVAQ
jgi:hypothetical protein